MTSNLAGVFVLLAMVSMAFQVALILGAPWGHLTQGRTQKGPLPGQARVSAAVALLILLLMSGAMLSVVGRWPGWPAWTGWLTVAVAGISMLMNVISPSEAEKRLWVPVSSLMFFSALGVMVF